jgi:hypothetical protein
LRWNWELAFSTRCSKLEEMVEIAKKQLAFEQLQMMSFLVSRRSTAHTKILKVSVCSLQLGSCTKGHLEQGPV